MTNPILTREALQDAAHELQRSVDAVCSHPDAVEALVANGWNPEHAANYVTRQRRDRLPVLKAWWALQAASAWMADILASHTDECDCEGCWAASSYRPTVWLLRDMFMGETSSQDRLALADAMARLLGEPSVADADDE